MIITAKRTSNTVKKDAGNPAKYETNGIASL
jgi:hypothetical protein